MSDLTPQAAIRAFAFGTPAPATPTPAATATTPTPGPPAPPSSSPVGPQGELNAPQAATMAGWIKENLANGKMTQAEADKAFDDLGTPPDQRTTPADTRTDEQKLIDQQFPVARPEEYQIRYADPGQVAPPMSKALAAFDQSARAWLAGAEFPRELGNSLVSTIAKVAQQTKAMSPDQLESYRIVQHEQMQRAHGEKLAERLQAADNMIDQVEAQWPGLLNLLASKGIGRNAMIWNMLIGQSEIYWARRKGR